MIASLSLESIQPVLLAHGWQKLEPSELGTVYQEHGGAHAFKKGVKKIQILSETWGNREHFLRDAVITFAQVEDISTFEAVLQLSGQAQPNFKATTHQAAIDTAQISEAEQHLLQLLAACAPCTAEEMQRELIRQCSGATIVNVATLQVVALAKLILNGSVCQYEPYDPPENTAWELTTVQPSDASSNLRNSNRLQ